MAFVLSYTMFCLRHSLADLPPFPSNTSFKKVCNCCSSVWKEEKKNDRENETKNKIRSKNATPVLA